MNTKSWFHMLDPRTKFVVVFILGSVGGFWNVATHTFPMMIAIIAFVLTLKVPLRKILPFLAVWLSVAPVGIVFNLIFFRMWRYQLPLWATPPQFYNVFVTNEGPPLYGEWSAGWVALGYFFRGWVGFFSRLIMLWTMSQQDYTDVLEGFKFPYWFAFGVSTSIRLLPVVLGSYLQILEAQKVRGSALGGGRMFIFSPNALRSLRFMVTAAVPLFYCTFKVAAEGSLALDSRGIVFTKEALKRKTRYTPELKLSRRDLMVMAAFTLFAVFAWVTGRYFFWGFKQW